MKKFELLFFGIGKECLIELCEERAISTQRKDACPKRLRLFAKIEKTENAFYFKHAKKTSNDRTPTKAFKNIPNPPQNRSIDFCDFINLNE